MKGSMKVVHGRTVRPLKLVGFVAALAAACGGEAESGDGMADMPGMAPAGAGATAEVPDPMEVHLARMTGLHADSLPAVLPNHRQMVANTLARMNREMAGMNMASDAAWNATVDSIRGDLTALPSMNATALATAMPAHLGRVRRLMGMHAAMMGR